MKLEKWKNKKKGRKKKVLIKEEGGTGKKHELLKFVKKSLEIVNLDGKGDEDQNK